jgi:hypothetical protein
MTLRPHNPNWANLHAGQVSFSGWLERLQNYAAQQHRTVINRTDYDNYYECYTANMAIYQAFHSMQLIQ